MELLSMTGENALFNILYRYTVEDMEPFENFMQTILSKTKNSSKPFYIALGF